MQIRGIEIIHTLEMPWIIKSMLEHYFEVGINTVSQYVGTLTINSANEPMMQWTEFIDPVIV